MDDKIIQPVYWLESGNCLSGVWIALEVFGDSIFLILGRWNAHLYGIQRLVKAVNNSSPCARPGREIQIEGEKKWRRAGSLSEKWESPWSYWVIPEITGILTVMVADKYISISNQIQIWLILNIERAELGADLWK